MARQSRTDQVHSYEFFLQRVVSGLVARESDPAELPFRRLGWAGFASVMVTVLIAAGFGVYGMLVGGAATGWRDGRSIVVERGTETAYLYREDRLHPMLNFVSAQLALGGAPEVARVSPRSIAGVPRGATLGIPGAPAGLPDPEQLLTGEWTLCSAQRPDGRGGTEVASVLAVGRGPDGGAPVDDRAVLVRDPDDAHQHLIWRGHRFPLLSQVEATLAALGVSGGRAVPVSPAWLEAFPVGDPVRPPQDLAAPGRSTTALDPGAGGVGLLTGQVIEDAGQFYLVDAAQLVEITPLQADILIRDPATRAAYPDRPVELVPLAVPANTAIRHLPGRTDASPPERRPEFVPDDAVGTAICAIFPPGEFTPQVRAGAQLPHEEAIATAGRTAPGGRLADFVLVEGGTAAFVESLTSAEATAGTWHIVTDQGIRYPLPDPAVAEVFGYDPAGAARMRAGLLALLPAGPALDPAAAASPINLDAQR